jgi:nitrate reductase NapD
MSESLHIVSMIVHMRPENRDAVAALLAAIPGVEVQAVSELGKCVITIEAATEAELMDAINQINTCDGVISAGLVYHHYESLDALEEESDP